MADFLGDLFSGLTGQQATPQQTIIPTNELLAQSYGTLNNTIAPGLIAYNQQMAPAQAGYQLAYENAINPYANQVRTGAYKSVLDQLNLGTQLPPELQDQVVRNALQGNAASGFGLSSGGRGLVARDLGLTGLNLLQKRQQDALQAAGGLALTRASYNPQNEFASNLAGGIAQDIRSVKAAQDQYENMEEDLRRQNFAAKIKAIGSSVGAIVGGIYGGGQGAQMGAQAGGSFYAGSRVAGQQQQQGGGGGGWYNGYVLFFIRRGWRRIWSIEY